MVLPSTDPRRFAIARRQRQIRGDDLSDEVVREIATEEVMEGPSREQQQADVYREIRHWGDRLNRALWRDVRDTLVSSGVLVRFRREGTTAYSPVASFESLKRLCDEQIVPLATLEPESDLFAALAYALSEGTRLRSLEGFTGAREQMMSRYLQERAHEMYDLHAQASARWHSPNL